jgi:hypothetical protein
MSASKEKFISFLINEDYYKNYCDNVLIQRGLTFTGILAQNITFNMTDMISTSFEWDKTPEGQYFWQNINKKWLCVCNNDIKLNTGNFNCKSIW